MGSSQKQLTDVIIGLEIHVPITSLKTKLFCSCPNPASVKVSTPNEIVCPICLGLPGALPRPNEEAIKLGIRVCKALHAKISEKFQFYRKHYFYPDLPKGYQISQYDRGGAIPLGVNGEIEIQILGNTKKIRINRIQVEEDPAKLVYPTSVLDSAYVLIDYNRSGTPLLEIVTEPDIRSPKEARVLLEKLQIILQRIGVINTSITTNIRCDANISIKGMPRVEIKNIGSFKDVEKALNFEIIRMKKYVKEKIPLRQETRHWDANRKVTVLLREKEREEDYRYFPDPNIPPIFLTKDFLDDALKDMPKLPDDEFLELVEKYKLNKELARIIVYNPDTSTIFDKLLSHHKDVLSDTALLGVVASLIVNEVKDLLKKGYFDINDPKLIDRIYYVAKIAKEGAIKKSLLKSMLVSGISRAEKEKADKKLVLEIINEILLKNKDLIAKAIAKESVKSYLVGLSIKALENNELWFPSDEVASLVAQQLKKHATKLEKVKLKPTKKREEQEVKERIILEKEELETILAQIRTLRKPINYFLVQDAETAYITGWLESKMKIGKIFFTIIRDGSGRIQTVVRKNENPSVYDQIEKTPIESFVFVTGKLRKDPRAPGGKELKIDEFYIISESSELKVPLIQLGTSSIPVRLQYRYLDIRRRKMRAILALRAKITKYVREILSNKGFTEIHTPKLIGTATEGGAELFPLLYYGREAFLAQSPQLYKQMALNAFEKVFEISAYFRAQPYDTPRHLSEFWSIDVEATLFGLDDLLSLLEDILHFVKRRLEENDKDYLNRLGVTIPDFPTKFPRYTYSEILEKVKKQGIKISWGDDLSAEALHLVAKEINVPFFIIDWPASIRAFYYKPKTENPKLTQSFDLMWPAGPNSLPIELSSGGERISDVEVLKKKLLERGLFPEAYSWYIDMFKYGMPPHGGFGLGLDRLVQAYLGLSSIVDTILCPRNPKYLVP